MNDILEKTQREEKRNDILDVTNPQDHFSIQYTELINFTSKTQQKSSRLEDFYY